jgi:hypothetical protein
LNDADARSGYHPALADADKQNTWYPFLRIDAVFGGAASVGWIFERILNVETPADTIVNAFARHALWIAITILLVSLAFRFLPGALAQRAMTTEMAQFVE